LYFTFNFKVKLFILQNVHLLVIANDAAQKTSGTFASIEYVLKFSHKTLLH